MNMKYEYEFYTTIIFFFHFSNAFEKRTLPLLLFRKSNKIFLIALTPG